MLCADKSYGDYPTLEQIKADYDELIHIVGNVTTIEQAKKLEEKLTIEINGISIDEFVNGTKLYDGTRADNRGTDADIEWIRYEAYGCLSLIYFYIKNGIIDDIVFNVWCNKWDVDFIQDTSIGNVEANYDTYIAFTEEYQKEENV